MTVYEAEECNVRFVAIGGPLFLPTPMRDRGEVMYVGMYVNKTPVLLFQTEVK